MSGSQNTPPIRRQISGTANDPGLATDLGLHSEIPIEVPEIEDANRENSRILKRLLVIVGEHERSAHRLGIELSNTDMKSVIEALRQHALKGTIPTFPHPEEVRQYVLETLFAEFVEEPSNILYTTRTGEDTMRYHAMKPVFWIESLDLLETTITE
ncbi:hypothetical protein [Luteolibacter sp. AS25]|uniref:hypothetical protein n=1 Tax=Luteolibacter sp. AS25 TaxID=3135776 RepID=UPI00398B4109